MSRNRHWRQAPRTYAVSGASDADLGDAERHLSAAMCSVDAAGQVLSGRPGFSAADVDRCYRVKRDLSNLLFNLRSRLPAPLTGDATEYTGNGGSNHD